MPQSFQWSVHKSKPVDDFKTGGYREMRVFSFGSSNFGIKVDIDGSEHGTVAPGQRETFRLPNKADYRVSIKRFDNSSGSASGTCDLQ
jgi:hypothetical protein